MVLPAQRGDPGEVGGHLLVDRIVGEEQGIDGLHVERGALVGKPALVVVDDEEHAHHQRIRDEARGVLAQARAVLTLQRPDLGEEIVGAPATLFWMA